MRLGATSALVLTLVGISSVVQAEAPIAERAAVISEGELSADDILRRVDEDLASLGSITVGPPYAGALVNGVQMQNGEHWHVMQPATGWATQETIDSIGRAMDCLQRTMPGGQKLFIGDIAREGGGHLRPHASHTSGRDVDLSYFYKPGWQAWYQPASAYTMDRARSWAFVRALITETDVEAIFIDMRVQKLLYDHALSVGESRAWLDNIFGFMRRSNDPIIRHEFGHQTHMHVRFYNPRAQRIGRIAFDRLAERKAFLPRIHRSGRRGYGSVMAAAEVVVPPRRLPPPPPAAEALFANAPPDGSRQQRVAAVPHTAASR